MRHSRLLPLFLLPFALAGCLGGSSSTDGGAGTPRVSDGGYSATITRTRMGIPHISASSYGSLGYGQAYAFAEDNLCVMMDDFVTIRGERARYFGPDGTYTIDANDSVADNVSSDFFWKLMLDDAAWQRTRSKTEPRFRELVTGWAAGFNRYIRELKAGQHPGRHAACATGAWLQPITEADLYRRFVRLSILASSSVFVKEIANAQPPGPGALPGAGSTPSVPTLPGVGSLPLPGLAGTPSLRQRARALAAAPGPFAALREHERFGSNMYAFGKDGSATGNPIVFGNPHFPWRGTERLYISHNTIPGTLDIMGVGLYGVPAVLIGFNSHLAWSHTVSTAYRFTLYELKLNPANPTQYVYDGALRDMTAVPLTVQVKQADGSLAMVKRTLYKTHFGPMLTLSASGVPVLSWSPLVGYTLRDANYENDRLINQFGRWNLAKSLDEFMSLHKSILGVPWVNTVASGPGQRVYYGDVTVVPNVPDSKVKGACGLTLLGQVVAQVAPGLPMLDGSRSACEWDTDADAPAPGIFGGSHLPTLTRDDYVHNCNDSYWLTHPAQPLTGYARIIGDENAPRSLRTRLCILQAQRRLAGTDGVGGPGGAADDRRFDLPRLQQVVLSSQIYSAELARQAVLDNLCAQPVLIGSNGPLAQADQSAACAALAAWDGKDSLASVGSHIWREFWRRAAGNPLGLPVGLPVSTPLTGLWSKAFSGTDPVNTPNTLNTSAVPVQQALADGIAAVKAAGIPFDRPLGQIQQSGVHVGERLPVFGGEGGAGAFTVIAAGPLSQKGYDVIFGNSYIQTVTWKPDGTPDAAGFITYSQSTDPANPHYSDFTRAYAAKQWQKFPFTPAEIAAQQQSVQTISE